MKYFIKYFLNGFLILAPLTLTVYVIVGVLSWLNSLFDIGIPGLGIALIVVLMTLVGFLGSSFLVKPFLILMERMLVRVPIVSMVYTSIRDIFSAFVGDNQKFSKPVMVRIRPGEELFRIGFITQTELQDMQMPGKVAVYLPHSYNISGELIIVEAEQVTPLDIPSSVAMKFVVSGGIAKI